MGCVIEIRREDLTSATAQALIEALNAYLRPRCQGRGVFVVYYCADTPVGSGAVRALGVTKLLLETGTRQPEAIALYSTTGYSPTGPFGEYPPSPLNVFFEKRL